MSPEVRAELLAPHELDSAREAVPVAYLPLGSLEFHGPHLPIGLDALNAQGVCVGAAEASGGVVLPVVYQGTGGGHTDYPWSIMMPTPDALRSNLLATLERLDELGFETAVLFTGHFADEQLALIDDVAAAFGAGERRMHVVATGVNRCPDAPLPPDHAGAFETTLLHSLHPDLVHLDRLPDLAAHPAVDPDGDPMGAQRHDPSNPLWGVFGPDPRPVDLSTSGELLAHLVAWLSGVVTASRTEAARA